jgi:hypothetical protein
MHSASCECVFVENEFKYRGEAVFQRTVIFHILTSGGGGGGGEGGGGAASGRGGD